MWPVSEPSYKGKPLTSWIDQLPAVMEFTNSSQVFLSGRPNPAYLSDPTARPEYAIKIIGSRSLPTLVQRLQVRDARLKLLKWQLWRMAIHFHICGGTWYWETPQVKRGQAITAITELGSNAKAILPDVAALAQKDPDLRVRAAAVEVLRRLSPNKKTNEEELDSFSPRLR